MAFSSKPGRARVFPPKYAPTVRGRDNRRGGALVDPPEIRSISKWARVSNSVVRIYRLALKLRCVAAELATTTNLIEQAAIRAVGPIHWFRRKEGSILATTAASIHYERVVD